MLKEGEMPWGVCKGTEKENERKKQKKFCTKSWIQATKKKKIKETRNFQIKSFVELLSLLFEFLTSSACLLDKFPWKLIGVNADLINQLLN